MWGGPARAAGRGRGELQPAIAVMRLRPLRAARPLSWNSWARRRSSNRLNSNWLPSNCQDYRSVLPLVLLAAVRHR